jgi:hypothetical protein
MKRTLVLAAWVATIAVVVASPIGTHASDPSPASASNLVLHQFTVAKAGAGLMVPLRFGGKDHLFLVDTGATDTLFDTSLPLGKRVDGEVARTSNGFIVVGLHEPPVAAVGTLRCHFEAPVASVDLKRMREVSGLPIQGVLGMDFLGQHVVHVDFDKGELQFLESVPKDAGAAVPMEWEPGDVPYVGAFLPGTGKLRFLIDTGYISPLAGTFEDSELRNLVASGKLRRVGTTSSESLSARSQCAVFEGALLALGGTSLSNPSFRGGSNFNKLGLGFWSRFVVTFDFPGRRVFLRNGNGYDRPVEWIKKKE